MSRTLPLLVFLSLILHSVICIPAISKNSSRDLGNDDRLGYGHQSDSSKHLLGSSVVTSVSVEMNPKNLTPIASPIELFSPEKYEFFALNDNGEVVKKTMTLNEIRRIVASEDSHVSYDEYEQEKINDVMDRLKTILRDEMEAYEKRHLETTPLPYLEVSLRATTEAPALPEETTTLDTALDGSTTMSGLDIGDGVTTILPNIDITTLATVGHTEKDVNVTLEQKQAIFSNQDSTPGLKTTISYLIPVSLIHPSSTTKTSLNDKLEPKEQYVASTTESLADEQEELATKYTTINATPLEENESQQPVEDDDKVLENDSLTTTSNALPVTTDEPTTMTSSSDFHLDSVISQVIDQISKETQTTLVNNIIPTTQSDYETAESDTTGDKSNQIESTTSTSTASEDYSTDLNDVQTTEKSIEATTSSPTTPLLSSLTTAWQLISPADSTQKKRVETLSPLHSSDLGLESTLEKMDTNKKDFIKLCNDLAFRYWQSIMSTMRNKHLARSVVMSPFAITSILSMIFLAARGQTTTEMNSILRLDGAFTFNPHYLFKTVTDSIQINNRDGVTNSALVRELFSDKALGELLNFYKDRVKFFYDGYVEEVNFTTISDIIRRRTNLFIKAKIPGSSSEYIHSNTITLRPPLAAFTATIFQTDCSTASIKGRDGEMYFIVLPSSHQRRLIQIPAVVHRSNYLLGYEPLLDTIVASIQPDDKSNISTVFVMPSRQSLLNTKLGPIDDLLNLENQLIEDPSIYNLLLRTLDKRDNMEIQLPRFSHRSIINSTEVLWKMGFNELLTKNRANLQGLGFTNQQIYLSDLMQINSFTNCANDFNELHREDDTISSLSSGFSDRQTKDSQQITRLRFNRPFLYFVRHNPTGLIVHMGRFNPRLVV